MMHIFVENYSIEKFWLRLFSGLFHSLCHLVSSFCHVKVQRHGTQNRVPLQVTAN